MPPPSLPAGEPTDKLGPVTTETSSEPIESKTSSGPCPACHGAGRVREFSLFATILAAGGFGSAGYVLYEGWGNTAVGRSPIKMAILLCAVGVVGLYAMLDRDDCKPCQGTGLLNPEEDEADDLGGEWDTGDAEPD